MPTYKHILFATDLTDDNHLFIKKVKKTAELHHAKLSVVHVVEHLAALAYSYMGSVDVEDQLVSEATGQVHELAKQLDVAEKDCYIEVGHPKNEILNVAEEIAVDLIIVGSHGRHGITTLIGSTTNAILHGASCDVLVIRNAE